MSDGVQGAGSMTGHGHHRNQKTPEPHTSEDGTEFVGPVDKGVKSWYQAIQMIYFKSFVNVLFRLD